jgi:hypothetical protein
MRKQRTRQHVIEDLGFNYIERQILYAGHIIQRFTQNDYGYDGIVYTFNEMNEVTTFTFHIQLKSTDHIKFSKAEEAISFDLSKRDLELWLYSSTELLLTIYDAQNEIAYYTDLQAYFREKGIDFNDIRKFVRVNIPLHNIFTPKTVQQFLHDKIK